MSGLLRTYSKKKPFTFKSITGSPMPGISNDGQRYRPSLWDKMIKSTAVNVKKPGNEIAKVDSPGNASVAEDPFDDSTCDWEIQLLVDEVARADDSYLDTSVESVDAPRREPDAADNSTLQFSSPTHQDLHTIGLSTEARILCSTLQPYSTGMSVDRMQGFSELSRIDLMSGGNTSIKEVMDTSAEGEKTPHSSSPSKPLEENPPKLREKSNSSRVGKKDIKTKSAKTKQRLFPDSPPAKDVTKKLKNGTEVDRKHRIEKIKAMLKDAPLDILCIPKSRDSFF